MSFQKLGNFIHVMGLSEETLQNTGPFYVVSVLYYWRIQRWSD